MSEKLQTIPLSFDQLSEKMLNAKNLDDLLPVEVQELYCKEMNGVTRAAFAGELREIAKKGRFVTDFSRALASLEKQAKRYEKELVRWDKAQNQNNNRVSIETVSLALQELGITLRYNQLLKEPEIQGLPPQYSKQNAAVVLPVYLMDYLRECGFEGVNPKTIDGCLACIADINRYNPIREYLLSGRWDGVSRFPEVYRILGISDEQHQSYIKKWFHQAVALGLNDDENPVGADGVLVLQGSQGCGKTSFFRTIAPFPRWFVEGAVIDIRVKDTLLTSLSGWITELGELDSTLKKEQAALKAFVTRGEDRLRPPYAVKDVRAARRTVFCATVNPKDFLKDETGSRRFWVVPIEHIDKEKLFSLPPEFVDQLWYESYEMYLDNPAGFRLNDVEIQNLQKRNREFEAQLPYESEICGMLNPSLPVAQWGWWRTADITKLLSAPADRSIQVGRALSKVSRQCADGRFKYDRTVHGNVEYLIPLDDGSYNDDEPL